MPDVSVVCNKDIIKYNGIHGAPDLIVEILSPSTVKYDRAYKKDLYEQHGVKEYWIVDPKNMTIEVHILTDGKYILDNIYVKHSDHWLKHASKDELAEVVNTFKTSLFNDLIIDVREVFEGIDDFE
ncbi:MAG: Uma2 family endonuclease [Defluviitaleaceae bacterium]|nr:Uma2 family endonuclease [Defluviitaleaceae bacterium]